MYLMFDTDPTVPSITGVDNDPIGDGVFVSLDYEKDYSSWGLGFDIRTRSLQAKMLWEFLTAIWVDIAICVTRRSGTIVRVAWCFFIPLLIRFLKRTRAEQPG